MLKFRSIEIYGFITLDKVFITILMICFNNNVSQVRLALFNAEAKQCQNSSVNRELQSYLKTTYRKEREQYNFKKAAADKQLEEAKQWVRIVQNLIV